MNNLPGTYALYVTDLITNDTRLMRMYPETSEETMKRKSNSFNRCCSHQGGKWGDCVYHYQRMEP